MTGTASREGMHTRSGNPSCDPWCPGWCQRPQRFQRLQRFQGLREITTVDQQFSSSCRDTSDPDAVANWWLSWSRNEAVLALFLLRNHFHQRATRPAFKCNRVDHDFWATLTEQFRDPAPCSQLAAWPAVPVRSSGRTNSVVSSMVTDGGTGIHRPKERKRHPGSGCLQSAMRPLALFHHWGVPDIAAS